MGLSISETLCLTLNCITLNDLNAIFPGNWNLKPVDEINQGCDARKCRRYIRSKA